MKFSRLTYIAFFAAVILRLIVLFSSRPYVYGGDSYSYIALSTEISTNHYLIPFTNMIHYPGSEYIFPPVIPYFLSFFNPVMSIFGLLVLLTFIDILLGSIPVFLVTSVAGKLGGRNSGIVSGFVYGTFPAFIYLDTWGDTAQLLGIVLILLLVLMIIRIFDNQDPSRSSMLVILGLVIMAFSHDLSFFFSLFFVFISIIAVAISNALSSEKIKAVRYLVLILVAGGMIGSTWYLLHPAWIAFLFGGFFSGSSAVTENAGIISSSIAPLFAVPYGYNFLSFAFFGLILISWIYIHLAGWTRNRILLDALLGASLIPAIVFISNPVLLSRFLYFASIAYCLTGSILLADILSYRRKTAPVLVKRMQFVAKIAVVLIIAMYLSFSVTLNATAHSYYADGGGTGSTFTQNVMLSEWIAANDNGGTVAAPQQIGFMIMAYAKVPVLVSENSTLLTQQAEVSESEAASQLINLPTNFSLVMEISSEYSIRYVVSSSHNSSYIFKPVFSNSFYTVYRITI
ncbi:MAG: hypothetical protein ACP5OC_03370 [Thermoplasmata archaeon]